jgi:Zn-finger protein
VALAVTPQPMKDPDQTCTYNNGDAKVRDLINMFPYHVEGDTCAPSYAPFFDQAADLIGEVCGKFVPQ